MNNTIVFAGDSITFGAWSINPDGTQLTGIAWAQKFATIIGTAKGFTNIINAGKPNDTAAGLLARLQADVISRSPDMVVIMIGRNDVSNISLTPLTPVAIYKQSLASIVQALRDAGISRILLLSWSAENHGYWVGQNAPPYLDAIAQVASEKGVHFIDVYSMWCSYLWSAAATVEWYDSHYHDNTHPNELGHRAIADFVCRPQFDDMFSELSSQPLDDLPARAGKEFESWLRSL